MAMFASLLTIEACVLILPPDSPPSDREPGITGVSHCWRRARNLGWDAVCRFS